MSLFCRRFLLSVLSLSLIALSISVSRQGTAAVPESSEVFADNPQESVVAGFDFSSIDHGANAEKKQPAQELPDIRVRPPGPVIGGVLDEEQAGRSIEERARDDRQNGVAPHA